MKKSSFFEPHTTAISNFFSSESGQCPKRTFTLLYDHVCWLCSHPQNPAAVQATPSPMTKLQSGHAAAMLQQLIAEADNKAVVFSDDLSVQTREQHLQGLAACQEDDVQHKNWLSKCQVATHFPNA
jgi:hypothetical protein